MIAIQVDNISLREDQRKHLSRNKDILLSNNTSSLDKYLQEMSQPGHWADGIMLACASKLFERQINILMEDGSVIVFRPNEEDVVETMIDLVMPTVFIGFITTAGSTSPNHYVLLQRKKNDADATSQSSDSSLPPQSACVSCCYSISSCLVLVYTWLTLIRNCLLLQCIQLIFKMFLYCSSV